MNPRFAALLRGSESAKAEIRREASGAPRPTAPKSATALSLEDMGGKWVGPCPACRAAGGDSTGTHLVIWPSGQFGCVRYPRESGKEHRSEMARLLPALRGGKGSKIEKPVDLSKEEKAIKAAYKKLWKSVKKEFGGKISDLGESTPIPTEPAGMFQAWCNLWKSGELAWAGGRYDAGETFRSHLFEPANPEAAFGHWKKVCEEGLDHASGVVWLPEATGRKKAFVKGHRLLVVEHDGEPLRGQIALIRYAREILGMDLRMVVSTGGKGIHGIFDAGSLSAAMLLKNFQTLAALGADAQSLGQSATRIPGAIRQPHGEKPGGKIQSILWINPQPSKN